MTYCASPPAERQLSSTKMGNAMSCGEHRVGSTFLAVECWKVYNQDGSSMIFNTCFHVSQFSIYFWVVIYIYTYMQIYHVYIYIYIVHMFYEMFQYMWIYLHSLVHEWPTKNTQKEGRSKRIGTWPTTISISPLKSRTLESNSPPIFIFIGF